MSTFRPIAGTDSVSAVSDHVARARVIHLAEGVLVGLLSRPPQDCLAVLIKASRASGLSTYAMADALVSVAGGRQPINRADRATAVVLLHWGDLLAPHDCRGHASI
jgi:hypothetical protein